MPVISAKNVQAASSYQFFLSMRRQMLKLHPEAYFYVVAPLVRAGAPWHDGADWEGPRTHVVYAEMQGSMYDDLALVTRDFYDRFNERFGDLYFDLIITERPMVAPLLKKLASFHIPSKSRTPLVIVRDQFVISKDYNPASDNLEMLQACGWVNGPVIFQSDHQAARAITVASRYFKPALVRRLAENSVVFPLGIDCDDVDQQNMEERDQKLPQITINYSHKLFLAQSFLQSFAVMDSVLAGGRNIGLQIVTGSSEIKMSMIEKARKFKHFDFYGSQSRKQFLRQTAKAHIFVSNSVYEDFSATVVEQIYTGLIPVMLDAPWSRYLVGDDYPFLFRDTPHSHAMLRYVVDHYEEIREEWQEKLQTRMKERFDLAHIVPAMADWFQIQHDERIAKLKWGPGLSAVLDLAWEALPEEFDLPMFYKAISANARSVNVTKDNEGMSTSAWLCMDYLQKKYLMEDLGTPQPSYRKIGVRA